MFKNYLLLALRNLRKNKLHSFINLLGMIVAFTCSIFIVLMVYRHFTYNDFQLNKSKLYKVYNYSIGPNGEETGTAMPYPLTPALKAENIGIAKATSILDEGKLVRYKGKTLDMSTTMVDEDFLSMFTFPVIKGNASNPLSSISNAVLTENSAKKLFGEENPIGKPVEVKLDGNWYKLIVTAVVKDFPENSTIKFSLLARTELFPHYAEMRNTWDSRNHSVYVELANNTSQQQVENRLRSFLKKYSPVDAAQAKRDGYKPDNNGDYESLHLLPFTEEHFNTQLGDGGTVSKPFLYVLMLISGVIILIASFNFVNLNIGLSFTRTKEIGIRKCLGAGKKQIWLQVWGESFLMVFVSMLIAIFAVTLLIKSFNQMFDSKMSAHTLTQPVLLFVLIALVIVVSFIASGYPSSVMSKLKTVEILKGKITVKKPGMLRNALIVTQFVIAIVLMCSTIIIFQQFDYLRSAPLGYNTQSIISIPIKNDDKGKEIVSQLRTRLASQSSVIAVTGSDVNLGLGEDHSSSTSITCFTYGDKTICGQIIRSDYDFLKTLSIKPISGRDFSMEYEGDTSARVIATKSYADEFGEKNITGFSYYADSSEPKIKIVGVIPDIQIKSLSDKQRPVVIYLNQNNNMNYALIKVSTANPIVTMNMIKKVYAGIEPGVEFKGSYVNENIDRLYKEEEMMANLFTIAAAIAIILSCMGLFGIASIIMRQRVKEIGVRKVLGASVSSIFTLVSKEFIKPVIIAFLIAVPLCWWAMDSWLQNYSHRVSIHWWVFAAAGIIAFIITICTISFQSIKAALANPVKSLRTE
jgi:ABC-type antimicrobial peptide transport system permease subunit